MSPLAEIKQVKEASKNNLLAMQNVVGVGIGYQIKGGKQTDNYAIVVMVSRKLPLPALAPNAILPKNIDGIIVDVIEVGKIRALQARTTRWRPAPGGVSIGHYKITAGTLGVVARDILTEQRVILSNNHILANTNNAIIGDAILQQGYYDGGRVTTHTIGHLLRYKKIEFGEEPSNCPIAKGIANVLNIGAEIISSKHRVSTIKINAKAVNYIDAALAKPISNDFVLDGILNIGIINGTIEPYLGMPIRKSGRTTGYTHGTVLLMHATLNVSYGENKLAKFENQIVSGAMSNGGDSGSLGVAENSNKAFGLLFAGSNQSTIFNPIQTVLDYLKIEI